MGVRLGSRGAERVPVGTGFLWGLMTRWAWSWLHSFVKSSKSRAVHFACEFHLTFGAQRVLASAWEQGRAAAGRTRWAESPPVREEAELLDQ